MHHVSKWLMLVGVVCVLLAGVGIGFTLALPPVTSAAPSLTIGTPTIPPQPTVEPSVEPTVAPQVTPTVVAPTATPLVPPVATARPTAPPHRSKPSPTPSAIPSPTPSATPEPWLTDVEMVKQADTTHALSGDTFSYTLLARNTGSKTAFDVVVRDAVPSALEVVDLRSSKGNIAVEGQQVTAYPNTLEAGETATYRITVRVRANAAPGEIANTALITTSTEGDTPGNNTSTVTVAIRAPERQIQLQPPPKLPDTAEGVTLTTNTTMLLATIPPLLWFGICGVLLVIIGALIHWGMRGRSALVQANGGAVMNADGILATSYRAPVMMSAGPPRLGAALPAAAPPAPLPPLVDLDRDDAVRDATRREPNE